MLIASLARIVHDVGRAEDLAQDALVAALEQWPAAGIPDNPRAWLMTIAKRRAVGAIRREIRHDDKIAELGRTLPTAQEIETTSSPARTRAQDQKGIDFEEHVKGRRAAADGHRLSSGAFTAGSGGADADDAGGSAHRGPGVAMPLVTLGLCRKRLGRVVRPERMTTSQMWR